MAQYAIIHNSNRVIVALTSEEPPNLPADFTAVLLPEPIDLANGPWKLDVDNATKVQATAEEFQATGRDEAHNQAQFQQVVANLRNAMLALRASARSVKVDTGIVTALRQLGNSIENYIEAHAAFIRNTLP